MNFEINDLGWILIISLRVEIIALVVFKGRCFFPAVWFKGFSIWYKSQMSALVNLLVVL